MLVHLCRHFFRTLPCFLNCLISPSFHGNVTFFVINYQLVLQSWILNQVSLKKKKRQILPFEEENFSHRVSGIPLYW